MKRIGRVGIASAALIAFLIFGMGTAYAAQESEVIIYATEPVSMRTGPGTSYEEIVELRTAEAVVYLGTQDNWTKVRHDGKNGYVFSKYLTKIDKEFGVGFMASAKSRVNVRSGPGTSYKKLGQLKKGQAVSYYNYTTLAEKPKEKWAGIRWDGKTGYVRADYLNIIQDMEKSQEEALRLQKLLESSGYFNTNAVLLGYIIDGNMDLVIRVSSGANREKVEQEITRILNGNKNFTVIASAKPAYVNETYYRMLEQNIMAKQAALSESQKQKCSFSTMGYSVATDEFVVGFADLSQAEAFRQWISDWEYITFKQEEVAKPKPG